MAPRPSGALRPTMAGATSSESLQAGLSSFAADATESSPPTMVLLGFWTEVEASTPAAPPREAEWPRLLLLLRDRAGMPSLPLRERAALSAPRLRERSGLYLLPLRERARLTAPPLEERSGLPLLPLRERSGRSTLPLREREALPLLPLRERLALPTLSSTAFGLFPFVFSAFEDFFAFFADPLASTSAESFDLSRFLPFFSTFFGTSSALGSAEFCAFEAFVWRGGDGDAEATAFGTALPSGDFRVGGDGSVSASLLFLPRLPERECLPRSFSATFDFLAFFSAFGCFFSFFSTALAFSLAESFGLSSTLPFEVCAVFFPFLGASSAFASSAFCVFCAAAAADGAFALGGGGAAATPDSRFASDGPRGGFELFSLSAATPFGFFSRFAFFGPIFWLPAATADPVFSAAATAAAAAARRASVAASLDEDEEEDDDCALLLLLSRCLGITPPACDYRESWSPSSHPPPTCDGKNTRWGT
mmetsp:Transcript_94896/g.267945  ORF Transcript_94896/g.267945 Transcript_94896/m.267945 type:complete len:478 (+) Transcript_94896:949-2382(+)